MIRWQFLLPKGCNWNTKLCRDGEKSFTPALHLLAGVLLHFLCVLKARVFWRKSKCVFCFCFLGKLTMNHINVFIAIYDQDPACRSMKHTAVQHLPVQNKCLSPQKMLINAAPAPPPILWDSKNIKHVLQCGLTWLLSARSRLFAEYMFLFCCIAEDAFKEHYFWELQSWPKALSFGVRSRFKMYLYFPNGQEEALTGIEVMLMQRGTTQYSSVYSTKIQPA